MLQTTKETSNISHKVQEGDQYFFGHGKLLLTGEYFLLDGAKGVALPTKLGQSMNVRYEQSFNPKLYWKSYTSTGEVWFEAEFEFWQFNYVGENQSCPKVEMLQKILRQARVQNPHFLREGMNIFVETKLGFPLDWGLGSSSSLLYNIAQWAYVGPFELLEKTFGGSGYDIACARSEGPIYYESLESGPRWSPIYFRPSFIDNLFFIHLNKKKNSRDAIKYYKGLKLDNKKSLVEKISSISEKIINVETIDEFIALIDEHEDIVSKALAISKVKDKFFSDFEGSIKSLGAWGGDFILAVSKNDSYYVKNYFAGKGFQTVLSFDEMIFSPKKTTGIKVEKQNDLIQ